MRLGEDELERAARLGGLRAREAALREGDRAAQVVALEGLGGGAEVPLDGALGLASALEVLGELDRVPLATVDQPLGGEAVTEGAVGVGQHRVRGLVDERVVEAELLFVGGPRLEPRGDELLLGELAEAVAAHRGLVGAAEQGQDAAPPERLAEHARGAQDAPGFDVEPLEPRLHHREDGARQLVVLAVGHRAHELLEEERVPSRALDDAVHDIARHLVTERVAHELRRVLLRQAAEPNLGDLALGPQPGKRSCTSGRERPSTMNGRSAR